MTPHGLTFDEQVTNLSAILGGNSLPHPSRDRKFITALQTFRVTPDRLDRNLINSDSPAASLSSIPKLPNADSLGRVIHAVQKLRG